jgi:hypothetical protein
MNINAKTDRGIALGNGEVDSSILSGSTSFSVSAMAAISAGTDHEELCRLTQKWHNESGFVSGFSTGLPAWPAALRVCHSPQF